MKDSIYFSHDADARSDEKIISLIMAHGYEGYGIFWAVVEMLRTATNYKMQLDSKRIAFALHADEEKVKSVLCDFKLFECKAVLHEEMFFSKSLNRRMKLKEEISEKRRNAAMSRWNSPAKAMQMHSKSIASAEQVQCNKGKKGKERKKEKKTIEYPEDFEIFMKAYPKRKAKADAFKAWKQMNPSLEKCLGTIELQRQSHDWTKDNGKYIPYPASWLRGGCWDDDTDAPSTDEASSGFDIV